MQLDLAHVVTLSRWIVLVTRARICLLGCGLPSDASLKMRQKSLALSFLARDEVVDMYSITPESLPIIDPMEIGEGRLKL